MSPRRKTLAVLSGILTGLTFSIFVLSCTLYFCGTSAGLMGALMTHNAPAERTGLPASEYGGVSMMITGYLKGESDSFQYCFADDQGREYLCFRENEQQHMADCRDLFTLCRTVMFASLLFSAGLWVLTRLTKAARHCLLGGMIGILLFLATALILLIFGLLDFQSLFILFHHIAFTNALWLMDPATDLIIRLMPTAFFIHYAAIIAAIVLGLLLVSLISSAIMYRRTK